MNKINLTSVESDLNHNILEDNRYHPSFFGTLLDDAIKTLTAKISSTRTSRIAS